MYIKDHDTTMGLTAPNCKVFAKSGCTMKFKILKDVRTVK